MKRILVFPLWLFSASLSFPVPAGLEPLEQINTEKYLGKWYEIARLDFYFERGLINTTAEYSLNKNGTIKVVNRGFSPSKNKWKEARGRARFRTDSENGALKVSFFGPFYSEYNIISIDNDYKYALVVGQNRDYMWILSREKSIPENVEEKYLQIAESAGIKTEELIWVEQSGP